MDFGEEYAQKDAALHEAALGLREDETDTKAFPTPPSSSQKYTTVPSATTQSSGEDLEEEIEKYNMRHRRRGVALIFNHEHFNEKGLKSREGAERDGEVLEETMNILNFEVRYHKDLTVASMKQKLLEVSGENHSDADCLLVAVMTHGEEGGLLHARDNPYLSESIWKMFTAELVPSLAGKPKIFIFQACRGRHLENSVWVTDSTDSSSSRRNSYAVPTNADFFLAYSTMEGYYSWRNPNEGSWFIQDLCTELKANARKKDFMTMMTFALRRVAYGRFSNVPKRPDMHFKKQMPVITSTLTRLLYFDETSL